MKTKKRYLTILLCIICFYKCNSDEVYLNPGIKLAYQFGENGGFVYGLELSCTKFVDVLSVVGVVVDLDIVKKRPMLHIGFEKNFSYVGIDFGPTFYFLEKQTLIGATMNFYVSPLLLFGFYGFTHFFTNNESFAQLGLYAKYPLRIYHGRIYDGLSSESIHLETK